MTYKKLNIPENIVELKKSDAKKSLTLRVGAKLSSNVYFDSKSYQFQDIGVGNELKLTQILKDSSLFSKVNYKEPQFKLIKKNDSEAIAKLLNENAFDENSDLQMNVYQVSSLGHAYLIIPFFAWAAVHLVSLGLIPLYLPTESLQLEGDFRDKKGIVIYKFARSCDISLWSWSPLLVTGKYEKNFVAQKEHEKNCINSVLRDAQEANVF